MKLVSVVVSVYNIERYIENCILSLVAQTYKNIEIILVDDGSKDHSNAICNSWAKKDSRVKVIQKNNGGLSDARNAGIKVAKGKYICFVDADDYVEKRMIELSLKSITEKEADVVVYSNYSITSSGKKIANNLSFSKKNYLGKQDIIEYFNECLGTLPKQRSDYDIGFSPWGRMIKREIITANDISFKSERELIYEDLMFLLDLTPCLKRITILNRPLYDYCENSGSLTRKSDTTRFKRISKQYWYLKKTIPYSKQIFENSETLIRFKRTMIGYIRNAISTNNNYHDIRKIGDDACTEDILRNYPIGKLPIKQRIFAYCLKFKLYHSISIITKLNRLKKKI